MSFTERFMNGLMDRIVRKKVKKRFGGSLRACLLYTSDAADEEDSVDLGGRRIIKKKDIEIKTGKKIKVVGISAKNKIKKGNLK